MRTIIFFLILISTVFSQNFKSNLDSVLAEWYSFLDRNNIELTNEESDRILNYSDLYMRFMINKNDKDAFKYFDAILSILERKNIKLEPKKISELIILSAILKMEFMIKKRNKNSGYNPKHK